jgi:hypothetical protein
MALAGTFVVGQTINYGQAKYVLTHDEWEELNPILDKLGKDGLLPWKLGTTALSLYIADRLPPKKRKWWLSVCNVVVWSFVVHDAYVGVKISF